MKREVKITDDGSSTLYAPELDEHYHSTFGAVQESNHVFIEGGLKALNKKNIKILEIGFGTGLNALLTLLESKNYTNIEYEGIEKYPVEWNLVKELNYEKHLSLSEEYKLLFYKMHNCQWNKQIKLCNGFLFKKSIAGITKYSFPANLDLIYFDAFAPHVQPEVWQEVIFTNLFAVMNQNSILVTYCAKGEVRRRMQKAGFQVKRLPGPPGKREMMQAFKDIIEP